MKDNDKDIQKALWRMTVREKAHPMGASYFALGNYRLSLENAKKNEELQYLDKEVNENRALYKSSPPKNRYFPGKRPTISK